MSRVGRAARVARTKTEIAQDRTGSSVTSLLGNGPSRSQRVRERSGSPAGRTARSRASTRGTRNVVKVLGIDYVSGLRKILGAERIVTRPPGYLLQAEPDSVDLNRFESLVDAGKEALAAGDALRASEQLEQALQLWRGEALEDLESAPEAEREGLRLGELRLAAIESPGPFGIVRKRIHAPSGDQSGRSPAFRAQGVRRRSRLPLAFTTKRAWPPTGFSPVPGSFYSKGNLYAIRPDGVGDGSFQSGWRSGKTARWSFGSSDRWRWSRTGIRSPSGR
jgi:hypothetical protein